MVKATHAWHLFLCEALAAKATVARWWTCVAIVCARHNCSAPTISSYIVEVYKRLDPDRARGMGVVALVPVPIDISSGSDIFGWHYTLHLHLSKLQVGTNNVRQ